MATEVIKLNGKQLDADSIYMQSVFDKIYPVGSIYISVNSTSPSDLFGGSWERLTDRFLVGAGNSYGVNTTGGSTTHTLTISEMPSHTHDITSNRYANVADAEKGGCWYGDTQFAVALARNLSSTNYLTSVLYTSNIDNPLYNSSTGGGQAFSITPLPRRVYVETHCIKRRCGGVYGRSN